MRDIKTYRLLIDGRVQGVGFRYFTEEQARFHDIKGSVRNTIDNRVEVICQGSEKNLESFFRELKKGPAFANVTGFKIESLKDVTEFGSFDIKY